MKNMDYEKKYNEALNWMRELYPGLHGATKEDAEHYFPELKESKESEDERIRKAIVELVKRTPSSMFDADTEFNWIGASHDEILAYLEKRKEQKPTVSRKETLYQLFQNGLITLSDYLYLTEEQKPAEWKPQPESLEALMYAIEGKWEMIKPTSYLSRRLEDLYDGLVNTYNVDETLIAELPKTAYSAKDIEELKALKDKIDASMNEKPAEWSEDDEKMRDYIIHALTNNTHAKEQGPVLYAKEIDWLQSLKNRGNFPKSNTNFPSEWSEEDEAMRDNILRLLSCFVGTSECDSNPALSASYLTYYKEIDWLESLHQQAKQEQEEPSDKGEISDGYHTFNELYYYRLLYNAAFFNLLPKEWVHKSKRHHDGEECFGGGWFIVMANLPTGQISNHYEIKDWDLFHIPEKKTADEWDGHTPQEAAERLHKFLLEKPDLMPAEYLPKGKINDIMSKLTNLSYSNLIPINSEEYKKIDEITSDVFDLLDYPIEQKPAEWSEEDRNRVAEYLHDRDGGMLWSKATEITSDILDILHPQPHTVSIKDATKFGNLEYERGVKDGIQHAKNHHWKPSEEQMEALSETIAFAPDTFKPKCTLVTLQDDLKNL